MSVTFPSEPEVLFQNEESSTEVLSATNPYELASSSDESSRVAATPAAPVQAQTSMNLEPVNPFYANLPSVHSVYSNASSPATPATKTYSRKRPVSKLGLNFQDLLNQTKRRNIEQTVRPGLRTISSSTVTEVQSLPATVVGLKPIQDLIRGPTNAAQSPNHQFRVPDGVQPSNLRLVTQVPTPLSPGINLKVVRKGTRSNNPG